MKRVIQKAPNSEKAKPFRFPYTVNVLVFDRPNYLNKLLSSMREQSLPLDESLLFFWVDGLNVDDYDFTKKSELVEKSKDLIKCYFPLSTVLESEKNLGIGLNYRRIQNFLTECSKLEWAVFLEDDFILHENYFETLIQFIQLVQRDERVVSINCSGDSYEDSFSFHDCYLKVARHSWGYAQRLSYLHESKSLLDGYYSLLEGKDYRNRNNSEIQKFLLQNGMRPVLTSQDSVNDVIRNKLKRISLTTSDFGLEYIGEFGVHFNPSSFQKNGFHLRKVSESLIIPKDLDIEKIVDSLLSNNELRFEELSTHNFEIPLIHQRDEAIHQRDELRSSTIWRVFRPYRKLTFFIKNSINHSGKIIKRRTPNS